MIFINFADRAREILANNVVYFRIEKLHCSQESLAQKIGTDTQYISEIENAKRNVS